jgi:hypothetical protein
MGRADIIICHILMRIIKHSARYFVKLYPAKYKQNK